MSMGEARRRCPQAVVLSGRHGRYGEVSRQLHEVFEVFTPLIEPISLDEAFLDVSGCHRLFGTSQEIAPGDPGTCRRGSEALLLGRDRPLQTVGQARI